MSHIWQQKNELSKHYYKYLNSKNVIQYAENMQFEKLQLYADDMPCSMTLSNKRYSRLSGLLISR